MLHNYASWGGLETYLRGLTLTNFGGENEKKTQIIFWWAYECIGG